MKIKILFIAGTLLLLVALFAACQPAPAPTAAPVVTTPCPAAPVCPECPACPEPPKPVVEVAPFQDAWAGSPHNDAEAAAFTHWNEDDPKEVPVDCARCHTTAGYQEFVSTGAVTKAVPAPAGTIQCVACHNDATAVLDSVKFPSGLEVTGTGPSSRCMECHQGRASKVSVDDTLTKYGVAEDPDKVPAPVEDRPLGFINIHYYAAGATLFGTQAKGGYEYDGQSYDGKFRHVEGLDNCVGCHNSHTLEIKLEKCQVCHTNVTALEDLKKVRMNGSLADYDGDGDVTEGIASEIQGLQETLYKGMQEYAKNVAGTGLLYDPATYPYYMADADGDGQPDKNDKGGAIAYPTWTGRLLKAAYNYQTTIKDPGAFAHNSKYMIQLLYDSIANLNAKLETIDMSKMHRQDPGHFAGNTEPFRHWDEEGMVEAACVRCHTAVGLPMFLENNATIAAPVSNGFTCSTCHNEKDWPNRYVVTSVVFPSGAAVSFGGKDADGNFVANESNLCLECHQGRSSTASVNKALGDKKEDTPDPAIRFTNIHYFAAGATLFGDEVQGAYEYKDQKYNGFNSKHPLNKCADCHDVHALQVQLEKCSACHSAAADPKDPATYRMDTTDYDGDGDVTEGLKAELDTFAERLYAAIQAYAKKSGTPITYDAATYPYFFVDANEDGVPDKGEKGLIGYNAFTPRLLKAAYNYQYYQKDPGAFVHNPKYVLQFLFDSIKDLGGDVNGLTRPAVPAP